MGDQQPIMAKLPNGIVPGDFVRVIYHGSPTAIVQIEKINNYSVEGKEGEFKCKFTLVGQELRFYAELSPNRTTVLRDVSVVKFGMANRNGPMGIFEGYGE